MFSMPNNHIASNRVYARKMVPSSQAKQNL